MRISSNLLFQTGLNSMNAQQSDLMHLYQQIGSGKRMVTPADDPLAAAQAINIRQAQSLNERFSANRGAAMQNLGIEDNTLSSVTSLLQDIKTQLIEAGNGVRTDADRMTLANVLTNSRDTLLGLANATDGGGQYLFSGSKGDVPPFALGVDGRYTYMGDSHQRNIQIDQTRQLAGSDIGSSVFMRASPGSNKYLTSAQVANNGTAVVSTPTVTDAAAVVPGNSYEVVFTSSTDYTVKVTDATGTDVTPTPLPAPPSLYQGQIAGDGKDTTLKLPDGLQIRFSGKPEIGDTFSVQPARVPDYLAGTNSTNGTISDAHIYDASQVRSGYSYRLDFTSATEYTVTSVDPSGTDVVPSSGPQAFTPGQNNIITLPDGVRVTVGGNPDSPDTFTITAADPSANADLNIFDTLQNIIDALTAPQDLDPVAQEKAKASFQNMLANSMQRMDLNYDNVLTVQSSVGARMNEIQAVSANGSMRGLSLSAQLSGMEDLDMYTATTQLQLRQAALEAAMLAFRKIQSTTMFNIKS